MSSTRRYLYYVEGETEQKLINEFKKEGGLIISGAVNRFNIIEQRLTSARISNIAANTVLILIFDTDKKKTDILDENISKLKQNKNVKEIWCVMQVENLEDELVRSTDVKDIKELIGSRSNSDFKRDFLKEKRLMTKLNNNNFMIEKLWETKPSKEYSSYQNAGNKIKIHNN